MEPGNFKFKYFLSVQMSICACVATRKRKSYRTLIISGPLKMFTEKIDAVPLPFPFDVLFVVVCYEISLYRIDRVEDLLGFDPIYQIDSSTVDFLTVFSIIHYKLDRR